MNLDTRVVQANALDLPLDDESVDLIITSPPYFALRSYRDGGEHYEGQIGSELTPQAFLEALWAATAEMKRVLKPSGSIWVNLGDKYAGSGGHNNSNLRNGMGRSLSSRKHGQTIAAQYRNGPDRYNQNSGGIPAKSLMGLPWRYAIGCVDQLGLILRAEVIWSKPNGLPESVTDRVRRSHEQWFHFTKSPRYFAAVDEIREPHTARAVEQQQIDLRAGLASRSGWKGAGPANERERSFTGLNPLGRLPGSVWTIPSEPLRVPPELGVDHFAAFPSAWPVRIIAGWSPTGICVECGEGRRPVVEKRYEYHTRRTAGGRTRSEARKLMPKPDGGLTPDDYQRATTEAAITGYACACPEPTADTRPAVVLDPFGGTGTVAMAARAMGRVGISVDLSADYCRLGEWRIFHSDHGEQAIHDQIDEGAIDPSQIPTIPAGSHSTPTLFDAIPSRGVLTLHLPEPQPDGRDQIAIVIDGDVG